MSLYNTINRATQEAEQLKSDRQLLQATKDAKIFRTLKKVIFKKYEDGVTIEQLKEKHTRTETVQEILGDEKIDSLIATGNEQEYYFYKLLELYDKEIIRLERLEKQKQKEIEKEQQEAEQLQAEKIANKQIAIDTILKVLGIIGLILLAPIVFIIFIIFEALKNTK